MSEATAKASRQGQRASGERDRACTRWVSGSILLLVLGACQGRSAEEAPAAASALAGTPAAPAPVATAAPGAAAVPLERAHVLELVQRWVRLQNDGDFAGYSTLYAPGFSGIKRVGQRRTELDRAGWLQDRQKMFQRDQRVAVSGVQILRSGKQLSVLFEQQWSSSSFADRGKKLLTLEPAGAGWQIAREEMLDSQPLAPGERTGACAELHAVIEEDGASVRYFAEITPDQQGAPMRWTEVRSGAEANERSPDGTAWELWSLAEREGWRLAALQLQSPSGDSTRESELCFRPDGTLAQLTDTYRTVFSEHGLVNESTLRSYAPDGRVLSSTSDARFVNSAKRAEPDMYLRSEPPVIIKLGDLPFASALAAAR